VRTVRSNVATDRDAAASGKLTIGGIARKAFLDDLNRRKQRSQEMLRAYRSDLEKYEAFLRSRGLKVNQAKKTTIDEFIDYLSSQPTREAEAQLSPASVARRLSVLSSYYEFLRAESNGRLSNPVANVTRPIVDNQTIRAVNEPTVQHLVGSTPNSRDRALLTVFISSGLRLSEVFQLNNDTIQRRTRKMRDGSLLVVGFGRVIGKGNKERRFVVDEDANSALKDYLRERGRDSEPALFISERGTRLSCRSIQDVLHRHCKRLNITRLHIHQLRHSHG
jgi:integrase/recombinase XerC